MKHDRLYQKQLRSKVRAAILSRMILNKQYLAFYKTWLSVFIIDVILNVLVNTLLIQQFYKTELSKIGLNRIDRDKPLLELQMVVYAVFIALIIYFTIKSLPKKNRKSLGTLYGAMFGVMIFLTHNMINYTIFKDWTTALVIIDSAWGIVLCMLTGFLGVTLYDLFSKDSIKKK